MKYAIKWNRNKRKYQIYTTKYSQISRLCKWYWFNEDKIPSHFLCVCITWMNNSWIVSYEWLYFQKISNGNKIRFLKLTEFSANKRPLKISIFSVNEVNNNELAIWMKLHFSVHEWFLNWNSQNSWLNKTMINAIFRWLYEWAE